MQLHQLLHILHFVVKRELHFAEQARHHFGPYGIMPVKRPSELVIPTFGHRLGNIMQQGPPTEPHIVALRRHIVKHRHRVIEIILMPYALHQFHSAQSLEFGENEAQQSRLQQKHPAGRRTWRTHNLHQLVHYAFTRYYRYAPGITPYRLKRFRHYIETELCGKTDGTHHAQRVVAERHIRVKRCADKPGIQVGDTPVHIDQFPEPAAVDTHRHGVDGEITSRYVVGQSAVLHNRVTAFTTVGLLSRPDEFQFDRTRFHLRGSKIAEYRQMAAMDFFRDFRCDLYAATNRNEIDILRRASQQKVTHISPHHVAFAP